MTRTDAIDYAKDAAARFQRPYLAWKYGYRWWVEADSGQNLSLTAFAVRVFPDGRIEDIGSEEVTPMRKN